MSDRWGLLLACLDWRTPPKVTSVIYHHFLSGTSHVFQLNSQSESWTFTSQSIDRLICRSNSFLILSSLVFAGIVLVVPIGCPRWQHQLLSKKWRLLLVLHIMQVVVVGQEYGYITTKLMCLSCIPFLIEVGGVNNKRICWLILFA